MACSDWTKFLKKERVRLWSCIIGIYIEIKRCRKGEREREREKCIENFVEAKREERKKKSEIRKKIYCVHKFLQNQKI